MNEQPKEGKNKWISEREEGVNKGKINNEDNQRVNNWQELTTEGNTERMNEWKAGKDEEGND